MGILKKKCVGMIVLVLLFGAFLFNVDVYAVFSINPTIRSGYTVYVNKAESNAQYIATYCGVPYVPLNQIAYDLGMSYSLDGNIAVFTYQNIEMKVDYERNTVFVNGNERKLQFGTVRKQIDNQQYLFFNVKDLQNIFGIIATYKEESKEVFLNTGFGVLGVNYNTGLNDELVTQAQQRLFSYANNIAIKTGCIISEQNGKAYNSLNNLFASINAPISPQEYSSGIRISGITTDTAKKETIQHMLNLKFFAGLSKLSVIPEYFGGYELSNGKDTMLIVGAFYKIEGLNISNSDLAVTAIATVEDTMGIHLNDTAAKELSERISVNASSARSVQHYIIAVVQSGSIKVIEVF